MRKWTDKEEQFLIDNYKDMDEKELSEILGRTQRAIAQKKSTLGLRRYRDLTFELSDLLPSKGVALLKRKFHLTQKEAEKQYKEWRKEFLKSDRLS